MSEQRGKRSGSWSRRARNAGAVAAVSALFLAGCSSGQGGGGDEAAAECDISESFPNGPIEFIVPFSAGGGTDAVSRLVAQELGSALGTQINVINQTGGGGAVGHQAIAGAAPDGQTIGMATAELAMLHHQGLTDTTPADVTAISQINADPAGITVAADAPYESVQDLIDAAEADPGQLVGSGTAVAGIWHVALAGMLLEAGLDADAIRWVPSEGAAPALQELVAGGIDVSTASLAENATMIESDRVKPLAVMDSERAPGYDDVPTLAEEGIDFEAATWRGIVAPAGMDEEIVQELQCHLEHITENEEFTTFMADSGLGIVYRDAEEFAAFMEEDDAAKGEIMQQAGLTGE